MNMELIPLVSYVIATTFSPGPNNISSASMGIMHGYKKTMTFLLGVTSGFFVVMIGCAFLSSTLLAVIPTSEKYLRLLGAAYIAWLAVGILRSENYFKGANHLVGAFSKGFVLQLFNPKVAVYGLTLFSTFLASVSGNLYYLALFALVFALTAFVATSSWALFGAVIKSRLKSKIFRRRINLILALLLFYTAVDLSGIIGG